MATETTAVLPMTNDEECDERGIRKRSEGAESSAKRAIVHLRGGAVTQVPSGMFRQLAADGGSSNVGQLAVFNRGQRERIPMQYQLLSALKRRPLQEHPRLAGGRPTGWRTVHAPGKLIRRREGITG
ncbi:hypothetical protein CTAM01_17021 [Colletotrichum tamarilloi]|uniref:Uncharacterized protein n=1 Tax=Colletotrichum tamarilloi TaxID=1209934 RepID=A0ABQ9QGU6_9PEZI|nr:uncharacterized protein CTAM01_17021 [Colletotrichum tamarilloi]KAK1466173.1 hypothetical protein CTAM01_17021 [Colletotrichum tamarilloi]